MLCKLCPFVINLFAVFKPAYLLCRRQNSAPVAQQATIVARSRWKKLKHALAFIAKVKLPDGPQGEMCRACQDDKDFGRLFLIGSNPTILRRCTEIPDKLPVQESDVDYMLQREKTLAEEARVHKLANSAPPSRASPNHSFPQARSIF